MKKAAPHDGSSSTHPASSRRVPGPSPPSPTRDIDYSSPKGQVALPHMKSPDEPDGHSPSNSALGESKVANLKKGDSSSPPSRERGDDAKAADAPTSTTTTSATAAAEEDVMVRGTFPEKLMALLERKSAPDAIWWLPDNVNAKGTFAISKVHFEKELSQQFNGNKWSSVARNLNRWGFRPVSYPNLPPRTSAYFNPFFQRERKDLLKTLSEKKTQCKAAIQEMEQAAAAEERKMSSPIVAPQGLLSVAAAAEPRARLPSLRGSEDRERTISAALGGNIARELSQQGASNIVGSLTRGAPGSTFPSLDFARASLAVGARPSDALLQTALLDQQRRQQDLQLQQEIQLLGLRQQQQHDQQRDFEHRHLLRQQVQQRLHQELLLQQREQDEIRLLQRKYELARQVAAERQTMELLQARQQQFGTGPTESQARALASSRQQLEILVNQQQAVIDELLLREAARRRSSGNS